MTYDSLINEIKSYKDSLIEIKRLKDKRSVLVYKLSGLKGVDTSKEPSNSHNESAMMQLKLTLIEEIGDIDEEIKRLSKNCEHTEMILEKLEPKCVQSLIDIYLKGATFEKEANKLGFTWGSGLKRYIETNIKERL